MILRLANKDFYTELRPLAKNTNLSGFLKTRITNHQKLFLSTPKPFSEHDLRKPWYIRSKKPLCNPDAFLEAPFQGPAEQTRLGLSEDAELNYGFRA